MESIPSVKFVSRESHLYLGWWKNGIDVSMKISVIQHSGQKWMSLSMKTCDSWGGFLWDIESIPRSKLVPRNSNFYLGCW
jgi:hypothetical protein